MKRTTPHLTKKLVEASMAVRFVVLFLEGTLVQLLQAERTDKMFWVVFPKHGCDASTSNRLAAACTQGSPLGMVVGLAVWHTLVVEE